MQFLEDQSSLPCEQREEQGCEWAETEYADFISLTMRQRGVSYRDVERASERKFSRSRLGRILNENRDKRFPIKLAEVQALLRILDIEHYQAAISIEMIKRSPPEEIDSISVIALMLSNALHGLPERILQLTRHIDGLDIGDILPNHGFLLQEEVLKKFEKKYRDMVERRIEREERAINDY